MLDLTYWSKPSAINVLLNVKASLSGLSSACMLKSPNIKFLCVVGKIEVRWSVIPSVNMELVTCLLVAGGICQLLIVTSYSLGHSMLCVQMYCFDLRLGLLLQTSSYTPFQGCPLCQFSCPI